MDCLRSGFAITMPLFHVAIKYKRKEAKSQQDFSVFFYELLNVLVKNIRRRMTPQPMKIRVDIGMKCFQFDGVFQIKVFESHFLNFYLS